MSAQGKREYPFRCNVCNKSYSTRGTLTRHQSYECGVAPKFECPVCRRKFSHKFNLQTHVFSHRNKQDFQLNI